MNRRGFIQTVIAGFAAIFAPKSKAQELLPDCGKSDSFCHTAYFRGYKFIAYDNMVFWAKSGVVDWIDLPTTDRIQCFIPHRGKLYWYGERETWEIQYLETDIMPFQFALAGDNPFKPEYPHMNFPISNELSTDDEWQERMDDTIIEGLSGN